jgi:hypothetical protein
MNDFDRQLKNALRRCEPSANFANRVLAHVAAEKSDHDLHARSPRTLWRWPTMRWAVAAAMLLLIAGGAGYRIHEQRVEEAQALTAKRQVMLALRITNSKLRLVKERVRVPEQEHDKAGNTL